jgi:glycosyltransferase involved in cell wall biosynthesis
MSVSRAPAVSIITPAFNAAPFLGHTIESALAQTFQDFELLIADDGSRDDTVELAREWARRDPRVSVLTGANGGTSAARSRAMQRARGSYFALLDSDDIWFPTFLAAQMAIFDRHPEADLVTGNAYNLGGPFDGQPLIPVTAGCTPLSLLDIIENENAVCIMSVFRRSVFDRLGGFDADLWYAEDYDYWMRAALAGFTFIRNPAPLALYRRRGESKSADEAASLRGGIRVLERARAHCDHLPVEQAAIDRQLAWFRERLLIASARMHLLRREFADATRSFERLHALTDNVSARLMAHISRRAPRALLWAYQARAALRATRRPMEGPGPSLY